MSEWKHVLTVEKSLYADDKPWYIEGVVSGPGYVDIAGDEFLPDALKQIADHINSYGVPLKDTHGRNVDEFKTIMDSEMGEITKAWIDDEGLLHVGGELDKTHPTSVWLRARTDPNELPPGKEPKKFGLSMHGITENPRVVMAAGQIKRQIADLIPDEISLTTRPFFQPSLGTVISKAMDEAAAEALATGDKSSMSDEVTPKADEKTVEVEVETKEVSVVNAADADPAEVEPVNPELNLEDAAKDDIVGVAVVEKSEDAQVSAMVTALETSIRNIVRQEIGNSKVEPVVPEAAASAPVEVVVEKSEDRLTIIEKAILGLSENMERLLDTVPETRAPGVLIAKSEIDEAREALAGLSPSERIRRGFELSEQKLR
jgi:hypothetical protein